jgi:hypothetical protein
VPLTWTVEVAIPRGTGSAFVTQASGVAGKGVRTLPGVSGQVFDVEVVGLYPGTPYCLRVRAVSAAGVSDPGSSAHCARCLVHRTHQARLSSAVAAHSRPRFRAEAAVLLREGNLPIPLGALDDSLPCLYPSRAPIGTAPFLFTRPVDCRQHGPRATRRACEALLPPGA